MEHATLKIAGMSCSHCVARVASTLAAIPGVQVEQVSIGSAAVSYDPALTSPATIAQAVSDAGYQAQPAGRAA